MEVITTLVILAIISLIAIPIVYSLKEKAKIDAYKRSIDNYGKSIDLALSSYLIDHGSFPNSVDDLKLEYSGTKVECEVKNIKENGAVYLSKCVVDGREIKDSKTEDGWYHYNERDLTNEEYVVMYGKALESALKVYHDVHSSYPSDYKVLTLDYKGKKVVANVLINMDGTVYLTNCKVAGFAVDITYGVDKTPPATQTLLSKANDVSVTNYYIGNTSEMYTFEHPETVQTPALTDYRYIGTNPNNYVYFNEDELWRIIGVFTVEGENGNQEQRVKIVRDNKLANDMQWDSNGENEWSTATLNIYLNSDYYDSLTSASKSMIADTKYYLGGQDTLTGGAEAYYSFERGNRTYLNSRSIYWYGKIGLLYLSDNSYIYALGVDNQCYNDGSFYGCGYSSGSNNTWIHDSDPSIRIALLSHYLARFYIWGLGGRIYQHALTNSYYYIYPSLYLKSTVKIESGDGSQNNPYRLKL